MAVALPILFIVLYLVVRQLRRLGAWINRDDAPKERAGAYVTIVAVLGFFLGGFSQGTVDLGVACHDAGQPVVTCIFQNS